MTESIPAYVTLLTAPDRAATVAAIINTANREILACVYQATPTPQAQHGQRHSIHNRLTQPQTQIINAIKDAAARTKNARILIQTSAKGDQKTRDNTITARYFTDAGAIVRLSRPGITMHAKTIIIDRAHVIHTTANLTRAAWTINTESTIIISNDEHAARCAQWFNQEWRIHAPQE